MSPSSLLETIEETPSPSPLEKTVEVEVEELNIKETLSSLMPALSSTVMENDTKNGAKEKINVNKILERIEFRHNWNIRDICTTTTDGIGDKDNDKVHLEYAINLKLSLDPQEIQLLKESLEALVLMKHIEMTDLFIITFGQMLPCIDDTKNTALSNTNVGCRRFQYLLEKEAANYISAAQNEAKKYNIDTKDERNAHVCMLIQQYLVRTGNDTAINMDELEKNVVPMLLQQQAQQEHVHVKQDSSTNSTSIMENMTLEKATTVLDSIKQSNYVTNELYNKLTNKSETSMKDVMENLTRSIVYDKIKLLLLLFLILFLIFIQPILICLKLETNLSSSWSIILIPFWIFATIQLVFLLAWFIRSIKLETSKEQQWYNFLSIVKFSCIFSFVILLALKLDDVLSWCYVFILVPIYVYEFLWFVECCINYLVYERKASHTVERRKSTKNIMFLILKLTLHTIFLGLLIAQLDDIDAEISWWIVFLPIWIITLIILLDSLCILLCSTGETSDNATVKEENELNQPLLMNEDEYEQMQQNGQEIDNKVIVSIDEETSTTISPGPNEQTANNENHVNIAVDFMNDGFTHYSSLGSAFLTCCCIFIVIIALSLFIGYLETGNDGNGSDYSSFWILFPFFVVAGIVLCCCCCCLWCLPNKAPNEQAIHSLYDEAQDTTTKLRNQFQRTIHEITS